ncbi:hypothetical protein DPQ31_28815 [Bacillus sp. COPE52]|nr:hypothetical protein DPQ31_28815 [Bacillus sp. COPE52]
MKFYHKLSYSEKFKRTINFGIPILIISSIIIFYLAPTTKEKIIVPIILLIIWLIQLLYTYKKSKNE